MTKPKDDRLLTFVSVYQSIRAENILTQSGIRVMAIPTPREIDLSCGQSILFSTKDERAIMAALREGNVQWAKLYSRDGTTRVYEKIKEFEG